MITDPDPKYIIDLLGVELRDIYSIPKYQRDFSWDKKHWERLYEDIENDHAHFFGAIICVEREKSKNITHYEIVDGQQRITTMAILICAIYKRMMDLEKTDQFINEKNREEFIDERKNMGKRIIKNNTLKLQLSVINDNNEDFNNLLREIKLIDQPVRNFDYRSRKLYVAFEFFYENLKLIKLEEFPTIFENIKNAYVIQIKADTDSSAYSIFESLNNTGQPLGPLDLIKNKFFRELDGYNSKIQQEDPIHFDELSLTDENALAYWNNIFKNILDRQDRFDFLKHYSSTYSLKEQVEKAKCELKCKNANEKLIEIYEHYVEINPITFLKDLSEKSDYYSLFVSPEEKLNIPDIKNELILLDYISAVPSRTFLLYIFSKYFNNREFQKDVLNIMIKYFIKRHITQFPDNRKLSKIFIDLIEVCEKNKTITIEFIESYLNDPSRCKPIENFKSELKNLKYSSGTSDLLRSIFWIIENPYRTREYPKDFFAKTESNEGEESEYVWTLEHILPQKMKSSWLTTLQLTQDQDPDIVHKLWVHTLGNLTLTGYNRNLSNRPFLEKLMYGVDSGDPKGLKNRTRLNIEFENQTEDRWTPHDIENRQNRLIQEISDQLKFSNE
jgi:uncharacterized protein with ParB-like and HNH nuclease domain